MYFTVLRQKDLPILLVSSAISMEFEREVEGCCCCIIKGTIEVGNSSTIDAGDNLSTRPAFSRDLGISCISATKQDLQSGQRISKILKYVTNNFDIYYFNILPVFLILLLVSWEN